MQKKREKSIFATNLKYKSFIPNTMMKEKTTHHLKEFMMTLLATTFSIVLTFGTSAIIERYQNAKAKKEMVMCANDER